MDSTNATRPKTRLPIPMIGWALGLFVTAILTGLAFAAWETNGPALFYALAANGLAWCL